MSQYIQVCLMTTTILCLPGDMLRKIYQILFMDCFEMLDTISLIKRQLFGAVKDVELRYLSALKVGVIRDLNNYGCVCGRLREIYLQVMLMRPRLYTDIQSLTRYNCFRHYLEVVHDFTSIRRRLVHRVAIDKQRRRLEVIIRFMTG